MNPPLARIPEGNWYCPSCIVVKGMAPDASEKLQVIHRRSGKKYQGEVTRAYMEALAHLAAKMEEKEYWEFTVDEVCLLIPMLFFLVVLSFLNVELVFSTMASHLGQ